MTSAILKTAVVASAFALSAYSSAAPLKLTTHLAQPEGFGVTSTLITGEKEAILIDAQFNKSEALRVAADILDSGKTLKTIFISYGDPDFYFGLETLKTFFPNAEIIATPETIKHIEQTRVGKLQYWGPQMGVNAPTQTFVPKALTATTLTLEGQEIEVKGKDELTYLWIPSIKAVVGGISVTSGSHLWMADTPTKKERTQVINALESIKALKPEIVVPAHMKQPNAPQGLDAVNFSIDYLKSYEKTVSATKNSTELSQAMQTAYPNLPGIDNLELGAKVVKGELEWK